LQLLKPILVINQFFNYEFLAPAERKLTDRCTERKRTETNQLCL